MILRRRATHGSVKAASGPKDRERSRVGRNLVLILGAGVMSGTAALAGIPPFGSLFGLPTACDRALALEPAINFNAGAHAISISMTSADFLAVERPTLTEIT